MATIDTTQSYIVESDIVLGSAFGTTKYTKGQIVTAPAQIQALFNAGAALQQIYTGSTAPTIASASGAGTSPTVAVAGSGQAHRIALTTGTSPTTGTLVTVTLPKGLSATPTVVLTPANAAAAALSGTSQVYVGSVGLTSFAIMTGSVALAASTAYAWNAVVLV